MLKNVARQLVELVQSAASVDSLRSALAVRSFCFSALYGIALS